MTSQKQKDLETELERLRNENSALKAAKAKATSLSIRASEKGCVSLYGLGRFPISLYPEQWTRVLEAAPAINKFIAENAGKLSFKAAQGTPVVAGNGASKAPVAAMTAMMRK